MMGTILFSFAPFIQLILIYRAASHKDRLVVVTISLVRHRYPSGAFDHSVTRNEAIRYTAVT